MIDPISVCKQHNILIIAENLGNVCGFYQNAYGQPTIHINMNCPPKHQNYTIEYLLLNGFLINPNKMKFLRCEHLAQC